MPQTALLFDAWSTHQRRHLSAKAEYKCTLQKVLRKMNTVVDALSRNTLAAVQLRLDYNAFNDSSTTLFCDLPWVLMGLWTSPKDTLDVSAAEMVYGNLLVIPAEFFPSATFSDDFQCISYIVEKFTACRQTYKPPAKHHIPTDLNSATHVFLCNNTSKRPLKPPYTGPFLVIRRSPKAFLLNIRCKEDWVSIDRLKPAFLLPDEPPIFCLSRSWRPI
ncbi:uncharacterized protein [Palaemon carinicauda]|uniref:uncharacterized protein n=1 Tax=Palaemon carinicauda TaxID=392227 RepID=UPI0035B624B2